MGSVALDATNATISLAELFVSAEEQPVRAVVITTVERTDIVRTLDLFNKIVNLISIPSKVVKKLYTYLIISFFLTNINKQFIELTGIFQLETKSIGGMWGRGCL
jgi:hypothetical protein